MIGYRQYKHKDAAVTGSIAACFALVLLFCSPLIAQKWWEREPYAQWSVTQINNILFKSPWARWGGFHYVRLQTAQPVRDALLRSRALDPGKVVSVAEATKPESEAEQARLMKFLKSNPDSFFVSGDDEHIVAILSGPILNKLSVADLHDLAANARFETDTGKRLEAIAYAPAVCKQTIGYAPASRAPARNCVQFFFKRKLQDGSPFLQTGDRELRFMTHLRKKKVRVTFKPKEMIYKGKLEY